MLTSVCFSRSPHCTSVAKLEYLVRKSAAILSTNIFQQKEDPDIFRYFKHPPGLKYSDQKGGHVRVKSDYMVSLHNSAHQQ